MVTAPTATVVPDTEELSKAIVRRLVKDKLSQLSQDSGEIQVLKDSLTAFSESYIYPLPFSYTKELGETTLKDIDPFLCVWVTSLINENHVNKLMHEHECQTSGSVKSLHLDSLKRQNYGCTKVYRRTDPSDKSMIVKDGYQWRKYGQKVTRDVIILLLELTTSALSHHSALSKRRSTISLTPN